MLFSRRFLLALQLASALTFSADAFGVSVPSVSFTTATTDTRLFAGKDEKEGEKKADASASSATTDILNSPEFLKRKLEVLKSDLVKTEEDIVTAETALEEGKAEWGDKFADLNKERKNLQERMNKASGDAYGASAVEVTGKLINVIDNFNRAFSSVTPESDEEKEAERKYQEAYQSIIDTLGELGVREVGTVGEEFDFEQHQAVMSRPSDDFEEGVVMEELQKGFILAQKKEGGKDDEEDIKLIRAAMVVVAA